jgi:hypothetical protein
VAEGRRDARVWFESAPVRASDRSAPHVVIAAEVAGISLDLIDHKFGVRLGVTAVGEILAKLGLTPQKPLQRAYQRNPEAIERWQRELTA